MTFYKRKLADDLIPFSSEKGKELFNKSLKEQYMENYFVLAEQFHTQQEPAFCGLGSLSMVLNSLQCDPNQVWKGVWRYYDENLLMNCCVSREQVLSRGLQMEQFWCLSVCSGLDVQLFRNSTIDQFRQHIIDSCKHQKHHLVVNFSRKALDQTGDGHFSPIGGYNPEEDMVLLLDVARFKYPSYWVSVEKLYEAMIQIDKTTNNKRGYFTMKPSENASSMFYRLFKSNASMSWRRFSLFLLNDFLPLRKERLVQANTLEEYLDEMVRLDEGEENTSTGIINTCMYSAPPVIVDPTNLPTSQIMVRNLFFSFCDTLLNELATCTQHKHDFFDLIDNMKQLDLYKIIKSHLDATSPKVPFYQTPKLDVIMTLLFYTIPLRKLPMNEILKKQLLHDHRRFASIPNMSNELQAELTHFGGGVKMLCDICKDPISGSSVHKLEKPDVNLNTSACKLVQWNRHIRWNQCTNKVKNVT